MKPLNGLANARYAKVGTPFKKSRLSFPPARQNAMAVGKQIAFYGSTPAYQPVLEVHGWGDRGEALTNLVDRTAGY